MQHFFCLSVVTVNSSTSWIMTLLTIIPIFLAISQKQYEIIKFWQKLAKTFDHIVYKLQIRITFRLWGTRAQSEKWFFFTIFRLFLKKLCIIFKFWPKLAMTTPYHRFVEKCKHRTSSLSGVVKVNSSLVSFTRN